MDKIVKYINSTQEELDDFFNKMQNLKNESIEKQRYIFYELKNDTNSINTYTPICKKYEILLNHNLYRYVDSDEKICLCTFKYIMAFNTKIYFKTKAENGFTFNKNTKKIRFWYGSNIKGCSQLVRLLLKEIKSEWFFQMNEFFKQRITKTLLEDILKGKITNPEQYIKKFMATSMKYKFHYKLIQKFFTQKEFYARVNEEIPLGIPVNESNSFLKTYQYQNKVDNSNKLYVSYDINNGKEYFLYCIKDYTTEPNYTLQVILNSQLSQDYITSLFDMFEQCQYTGDKINIHWSYKRLNEEHLKLTRKLTKLKFSDANNEPIKIFGKPSNYQGIDYKLLDNEMITYMEGTEMHHCVYSNYWNKIESKNYFGFSINTPERCTLGINATYGKIPSGAGQEYYPFSIDQVYLKYDKPVKPETRELLEKWIKTDEMQNFFCKNYKTFDEEDIQTLYDFRIKYNIDVQKVTTKQERLNDRFNFGEFIDNIDVEDFAQQRAG